MKALWYLDWRKFEWVIEKAKESCKNSWNKLQDHFVGADKMINLGKWWQREIKALLRISYEGIREFLKRKIQKLTWRNNLSLFDKPYNPFEILGKL
jgi:hypothetical protein